METINSLLKSSANYGLALVIVIVLGIVAYRLFFPYLQKKLEISIKKDNEINDKYIGLLDETIQETKQTNKEIMKELKQVNKVNIEVSETNKKLADSIITRIDNLENTTNDIKGTVNLIKDKIDK